MQALQVGVCSPVATVNPGTYSSPLAYGSPIHSPEMKTACPQPLRALPDLPAFPYALLGPYGSPEPIQFYPSESRPLSSVSTSAGPSPDPEDGVGRSELHRQGKPLPPQRKIFVGGIPQDIDQNELHAIFTWYGEVSRAWLQRPRSATESRAGPQLQHRGFGFVIFKEAAAVDDVLSGSFSRFLTLRCGRQLEVKRAVTSGKMTETPPGKFKQLSKGVEQTDILQPNENSYGQRQVHTQYFQNAEAPYISWTVGSDGDSQSERSGSIRDGEPCLMQHMHSPNLLATAPLVIPQFTSGIGDWQSEMPNTIWGSERCAWQPSTPSVPSQTASATISPVSSLRGFAAEGQSANFVSPHAMLNMTQTGAGVFPFALVGPETLDVQASPMVMPCPELRNPVLQLSQIGVVHMEEGAKKDLEAMLLCAAPDFYED